MNKKSINLKKIRKYRWLYVMFLPVLLFVVIFYYIPMFGIFYAFFDYKIIKPAEFVGLDNFRKLFALANFRNAFLNTLVLSIVKLLSITLAAVVISVLLNELRSKRYKKITQTVIYMPHFLSWIVTASIFALILSPGQSGLVNAILVSLGIIEKGNEIYFLGSQQWWRPMFYIINIWKETGWQTIVLLATLSGINPELYEAASIDGAGRWQKIKSITLPALANTIIVVLILNMAYIMNLFEPVYVLQNDAVIKQSQVMQTYIFNQTFNSGTIPDYGYTTAVGLFNSVIGCILVLACNLASKKVRGRGII